MRFGREIRYCSSAVIYYPSNLYISIFHVSNKFQLFLNPRLKNGFGHNFPKKQRKSIPQCIRSDPSLHHKASCHGRNPWDTHRDSSRRSSPCTCLRCNIPGKKSSSRSLLVSYDQIITLQLTLSSVGPWHKYCVSEHVLGS